MTETEYIILSNRVRISSALATLKDVLAGESYGVSQEEKTNITAPLYDLEQKLFAMTNIEVEDDTGKD